MRTADDLAKAIKLMEGHYEALTTIQTESVAGAPSRPFVSLSFFVACAGREQKHDLAKLYVKCTQGDMNLNNAMSRAKGVKAAPKPKPKGAAAPLNTRKRKVDTKNTEQEAEEPEEEDAQEEDETPPAPKAAAKAKSKKAAKAKASSGKKQRKK